MNYSHLFARAGELVWRHKFLWLLGFLASIGSSSTHLIQVVLMAVVSRRLPQFEQWLAQPAVSPTQADDWLIGAGNWFLGGVVAFLLLSLLIWLVMTLAEGALIGAVLGMEEGQLVTVRPALGMGWSFLARFIAIDTLVFFPLFLLMLAIMLLALVGLVGATAVSLQGRSLQSITTLLGTAAFCLLPLICLLLPVGFLTVVFRTLAFRDTAVYNSGARASIRHTWAVIRQHMGQFFVLLLLLWGTQYVMNMILSLITVPLFAVTAVPPLLALADKTAMTPVSSSILTIVSLGVALGTAVLQAILHTFISTVWTVAYVEITNEQNIQIG